MYDFMMMMCCSNITFLKNKVVLVFRVLFYFYLYFFGIFVLVLIHLKITMAGQSCPVGSVEST
jgi:hypothetical protein